MEKILELIEGEISYLEGGSSESELAVIFIHGNSLSSEIFLDQLADVEFQKYNTFALDLFGHGNSATLEKYSIDIFVNQVCDFIEALNLKNVVLVGNSLGGHIAIRACSKNLNIKGLALFGTPPLRSEEDIPRGFLQNPAVGSLFSDKLSSQDINNLISELDSNAANHTKLLNIFKITDPKVRSCIGGELQKIEFNEINNIENLPYKVMLISCLNDRIINSDYITSLGLKNLYKDRAFVLKCSHLPQLDSAKELNGLIVDYITSIF